MRCSSSGKLRVTAAVSIYILRMVKLDAWPSVLSQEICIPSASPVDRKVSTHSSHCGAPTIRYPLHPSGLHHPFQNIGDGSEHKGC